MTKNGFDNKGNEMIINEEFVGKLGEFGMVEVDEFDYILTSIPSAPEKETISKILLELPTRLLYLKVKILEYQKEITNTKTYLNTKKKYLDVRKSEIRKALMDDYNEQLSEYRLKSEELMGRVMSSSENAALKKTYLQEMLKVYIPNKPSKSDLDDEANVLTSSIQDEINELENRLSDFSLELEILNTKKEFYENTWITIRKYTGVLIEEMRMRDS